MTTINVPTREEVSPNNQAIFDNLKKGFGMVPNLFATFAHSETALATYLAFQGAKSSVSGKAREVVYLVVCNGQVKPDTFLSHFPIVFPLKNQRRLIA
jgi:hypothetical protein